MQGLEPYDGAPTEEIRGAVRTAFESLIELCLTEEVDFLVLAGDLYDGDWRDFNTGLYFVSQMVRLREADIPVFIVHGNHDAQSQITRQLPLPQNVRVFSSTEAETHFLEDLKVAFHGQSFPTQHVTDNLVTNYPKPVQGYFNIGLLHTAIEGYSGHASYAPCSMQQLTSFGYDYWALGHVHQYQILSEDPYVVFPGNLQGRHVRETGSKGCCVVEIEDARVLDVKHHPLDNVRWASPSLDVSNYASIEEVKEGIKNILSEEFSKARPRVLAVRLNLMGQTSLHSELVRDANELTNSVRAIATDLGSGEIYLEKIKITATPANHDVELTEIPSDALSLISSESKTLVIEGQLIEALGSNVRSLLDRLPPTLKARADNLNLEDPKVVHQILTEAQGMILGHLAEEEEEGS
ncbi:DNA repair exonuclease [Dehalococcoides mccartyi]|nr:DNA repair exonuclease [Dehalococcoides mccartyi]